MRAWHIVVFLAISGLGLGGYHACNLYRVESLRDRAYHKLDDITQVRGARPLTAAMVRKRVVDWLGDLGVSVLPKDVSVRIAPVTRDNEQRLSVQARRAIAIARKLPNHEIHASIMTLDVTAKAKSGWVSRKFSIHRTYLVKGPAEPTGQDDGDDGDTARDDEDDDS